MLGEDSELKGILPVYKLPEMTSFSLVARVRRKLSFAGKIGHTGTLDAFAEGVLVLLLGREYTKMSDQLMSQDKAYLATLKLGQETDTLDPYGTVVHTSSIIPSLSDVISNLSSFQGHYMQEPPLFSAKKHQGRRASDWVRSGHVIAMQPACVHIHSIELVSYEFPFIEFRVTCSKGTYIRSIGKELAQKMGARGHLVRLIREMNGKYLANFAMPFAKFMDDPVATASQYIIIQADSTS